MELLFISVAAFLVPFFAMPLCRQIAYRLDIMDVPGGRKIHKKATPLLGGVGIYLGILIAVVIKRDIAAQFWPVLLGGTIILILGVLDDMKGLSAVTRLIWQLIASFIIISAGLRITILPFGPFKKIVELFLTLFWLIGVTNAYNYLDGLDGLAAGSAVVNAFCFGVILLITGQHSLGYIAIIIMAACLGFLPYNFSKKKIFLGDAGSTFLGFTLAGLALVGDWAEDNIVKISIPILILGVPIFDMIFTTIMRIKEEKIKTVREWLAYGGKDHFHHYLVYLGLSPMEAVIFIYAITLSFGISAVSVSRNGVFEAALSLLQASILFVVIALLIVVGKNKRSGWNKT